MQFQLKLCIGVVWYQLGVAHQYRLVGLRRGEGGETALLFLGVRCLAWKREQQHGVTPLVRWRVFVSTLLIIHCIEGVGLTIVKWGEGARTSAPSAQFGV